MDKDKKQIYYMDKVVRRSGNCLAAKLPALLCKTLGITAGSEVHCYMMDGDLLLRFPNRIIPTKEAGSEPEEVF